MQVSVLTLVRGRRREFERLVQGLNRQTRPPDRLVIAFMQPEAQVVPHTGFEVLSILVPGEPMPLAAARNRAAEAAGGGLLVFLDVDCIPAPGLVAGFVDAAGNHPGLLLGDVLYLPAGGADRSIAPDHLDGIGVRHPARPVLGPAEIRIEPDHGALWGLCFAMTSRVWQAAGGMDERYSGYGGEETDFAACLQRDAVPVHWVGAARAYHQHHRVHRPPLQHFEPIVRNARLFHGKWNRWCMEYWLGQFRDQGLIDWTGDRLEIVRAPSAEECAHSLAPADVCFS